jgi:hypothetical protein
MASSNLEQFSIILSENLATFVLLPIVDYLKNEKNIDVTVDELSQILKLPSNKTNYISSLGESGKNSTVSSLNKKNNFTEQPIHGQCEYKLKRGEFRNLYCGKPTEKGFAYCKQCIKSRKLTPKISSGSRPGVAPSNGSIPTSDSNTENELAKIDVLVFDENKKLYRERNNNFIGKILDDDFFIIGKVANQASKNILPLDDEDKEIALSMSLSILEDSKYLENTTKIPSCPGINLNLSNYPEIPNASSTS